MTPHPSSPSKTAKHRWNLTILAALASSLPLSFQGYASNGLAPEVTDLNAADVSYTHEQKLPYLEHPFIRTAPKDRNDGIAVGELGPDGGDRELILAFARDLGKKATSIKTGRVDSLLISYQGKLLFESYYRRGRANYPHYQMSITKSYTAMALGRAMQLGYLTMDDLDRPVVSFLDQLDQTKLVDGADEITLHESLHMSSGIRLKLAAIVQLRRRPAQLKGQGQIQAYLQHSAPIPPAPRPFKYQGSDPSITMQVIEALVPGTAQDFIRDELWKPLGVTNYRWQDDLSGLPKSAAGSSVRSRDMLKMGELILNKGHWHGKQLIPEAFIKRATSPVSQRSDRTSYGYFWWVEAFQVNGKSIPSIQGRGAGGQFIFVFPDHDLVAVITSHNKGMGNMLRTLPQRIIPAFPSSKDK